MAVAVQRIASATGAVTAAKGFVAGSVRSKCLTLPTTPMIVYASPPASMS